MKDRILIILILLNIAGFIHMVPEWRLYSGNGFSRGMDAFRVGNYSLAKEELLPFAERGDSEARFFLGTIYAFGLGDVEKDFNKAKYWFRCHKKNKSCAHGKAEFFTGLRFLQLSEKMEKDKANKARKEALCWFRESRVFSYWRLRTWYPYPRGTDGEYLERYRGRDNI